jgi:uncharacterized protein (DUF983 family)
MTDLQPQSDNRNEGQPGLVPAALLGLCPGCGARTLFGGVAQFAPKCASCGLDYGKFNVGDGPAAFLTLIIGALITVLAIWLEFAVHPPLWVHALLWVPLTAAAVVWGLRVSKAALLVAEFQREARELTNDDFREP